MLEINQLTIAVEGREILHEVNLKIGAGETHVLFGPNGSGVSLLDTGRAPRTQSTTGLVSVSVEQRGQ